MKLRAGVDGVPKYPNSDRDAAENPKGYVFDMSQLKKINIKYGLYTSIIASSLAGGRERKHGTNRNSSTHGFPIKSSQHWWKAALTLLGLGAVRLQLSPRPSEGTARRLKKS